MSRDRGAMEEGSLAPASSSSTRRISSARCLAPTTWITCSRTSIRRASPPANAPARGPSQSSTKSRSAVAPHELTRALLPRLLASGGVIVSVSSDAAVDHYPTWGAYGAGKAALDHLTATWAAEENLLAYAVDPGDLRTALQQAAFPGEDISDRPLPATVVPAFLEILRRRPPSGRYRAADFLPVGV
jgi:NAD(P)-dependent dehydrogenase (short-subunit alcohol dehydrogenase family)